MPMFSTAPGPPQSLLSDEGRTHKISVGAKLDSISFKFGILPKAISLITSKERATVLGTGKSNLTSLCRHFARPP